MVQYNSTKHGVIETNYVYLRDQPTRRDQLKYTVASKPSQPTLNDVYCRQLIITYYHYYNLLQDIAF